MQTETIQPNQIEKLKIINRAVEQIQNLLEEIMFLARANVATSSQELSFAPVAIKELLQSLSQQFMAISNAKNITIETQFDADVLINGDRLKLIRLLTNIIENALNYSNPGDRILLSTHRSHRTVTVTIQDTGAGIAPENLPYIFEDFWRSDLAISRRPKSSGLGLSIAQAIVQQHGGKIIVSSEVGIGSCVEVKFPILNL